MKKNLKYFCIRTAIASIPIILLVVGYIWEDPFRVIWNYDPYFTKENPMMVGWNKSVVSTQAFDNNYKKQKYNSFVFGSSLAIGYGTEAWRKHLPDGASIFHFDVSAETVRGMLLKMKYINEKGLDIDNALIVFNPKFHNVNEGAPLHLVRQHYNLTPEWDYFDFEKMFFKLVLNRDFTIDYLKAKFSGEDPSVINKTIFNVPAIDYDAISNEERYDSIDNLILHDESKYYTPERISTFLPIPQKEEILPCQLSDSIRSDMKEIRNILSLNKTDYKIILPPNCRLYRYNQSDLEFINETFGTNNVYNFQGKNKMSVDYKSFYDNASHPRPKICKIILDSIYKDNNSLLHGQ